MTRILGIILLAGLLAGVILIVPGASPGQFIDYPLLILVVGGTLAVLLISHGGTPWKTFLGRMVSGPESLTDEDRLELADFLATGSRAALACGLVGQLIGLVIMLGNMDDMIGPCMAVYTLSILYGIVLSEFVFQPLQKSVARKLRPGSRTPSPRIGLYLVFIVEALLVAQIFMISACGDPGFDYELLMDELSNRIGQR